MIYTSILCIQFDFNVQIGTINYMLLKTFLKRGNVTNTITKGETICKPEYTYRSRIILKASFVAYGRPVFGSRYLYYSRENSL